LVADLEVKDLAEDVVGGSGGSGGSVLGPHATGG
jgi:hypothetical protein